MKVSLNWIKEYTAVPLSPEAYKDRMVMCGTGVEGIVPLSTLQNVVVGRVLECEAHPNSDHLHVCKLDVGQEEPLQIVCGAPNVAKGQLVPVALVGAVLPGGLVIKKGKLRGVESCGMICSSEEMEVPQSLYPSVGAEGILVFQEDYPLGMDVKEVFHINDVVVDFEILANRPDCLSVWGVARESAVAMDSVFRLPEVSYTQAGGDIGDYVKVEVQNSAQCPRYMMRAVRKVRVGPSPLWLRAYLHAAGMRSINNIVDITNFVMLETGHPMHAFDLSQVRDRTIIVRNAHQGEHLTTLDGKEHSLRGNELLICDAKGPTGLAGIMGGLESEITGETRDVLFECASFDRTLTRIVSRQLGIRTESGSRFERGVNPATVKLAMDRACHLVEQLGAGEVVSGEIDLYPEVLKPVCLKASVKRIAHRTGVALSGEEMAEILTKLLFKVELHGDELVVTAPDFRQDIQQEADLSEEVLRIAGYDRIPETLLRGETTPGGDSLKRKLEKRVEKTLHALGFDEIFCFSFLGQKTLELLGLPQGDARLNPVRIRNPLGEDTAVMRTTLAADMIRVLSSNQNAGNSDPRLYEFGKTFDLQSPTEEGLFTERNALSLGMSGGEESFYTLRDAVLSVLEREGIAWDLQQGGEPYHHPARCVRILSEGRVLACVGELHPEILERFGLLDRACLAEVDMDQMMTLGRPMGHVKALSRTPAVRRDIALVLGEEVPLLEVSRVIERAAGKTLESLELFDVYRGKQLGENQKSAAFALVLRGQDQTLEELEIKRLMDKVIKELQKSFNAQIRT